MCVLYVQVLFRKYGWSKASIHHPKYRKVNKQYRLDKYSSKGSTVKSQKQVHEKMLLYASQSEGKKSELLYGQRYYVVYVLPKDHIYEGIQRASHEEQNCSNFGFVYSFFQ